MTKPATARTAEYRASDALEELCAAIEEMDRKMEVESSDQDGFIVFYRLPCGPWHRILGLVRGGLVIQASGTPQLEGLREQMDGLPDG